MRHRVTALFLFLSVVFIAQAQQSSFNASISPNPLTLQSGGASRFVLVTTQASGYVGETIRYSFSGFPSFIQHDGPWTTTFNQASSSPYGGVTFTFAARPGAPGGTYAGTLTGVSSEGVTRTFPFTVIVQQPDLMVSVTNPQMSLCAGAGPQSNSVRLEPVNGYQGTPQIEFVNVPAGVVISPNPLSSPPIPPGQTIPFTVGASQPGSYTVTVRVTDSQYALERTATFVVNAAASDYTAAVAPLQVALTAGSVAVPLTASITPLACMSQNVTVRATPPPGISVTPDQQTIAGPGYPPVTFNIQAGAAVPAGTYPVNFVFSGAGIPTRNVTVYAVVSAAPDFVLRVMPPSASVAAGSATDVEVSVESLHGFQGSVAVTGVSPAGVTLTPSIFTITPVSPQRVVIHVPRTVAPGQYVVTFTGTAPGVSQPRTATLTLNVTPAPDFVLVVTPPAVSVAQGGATTVVVTAPGSNGFADPVGVTVSGAAHLTVTPSSFSLSPGASQLVTITAAPGAPTGVTELTFTGVAASSGIVRTAELQVTITPLLPVITTVDPPAVTNGMRSVVVRLSGLNFAPAATVTSRTPGIIVERTEVVSSSLALVTLSVRSDAAAGPYLLDLRNPSGGMTQQGATLLVYPHNAIAAPLGVTAAAIVFPRSGTMVAANDAVYARGLLATTGSGTIVGEWRLDGVTFDAFTAVVAGGMPTEVRAHVPIPPRPAGSSRLELVVTAPQLTSSPAVTIVHAIDSASRLQLYAPADRTVLNPAAVAPLFRWSFVPGVTGYEVEVFESDDTRAFRIRTSDAEWRPSTRELETIGHGIRRWRVRPVFPGEVRGEPARWQRFIIVPTALSLSIDRLELDAAAGRASLAWSGGAPGVIYRIEFVDDSGAVVLQALSLETSYRAPRALASTLAGTRVRIVALAPDGTVLASSEASRFAAETRDRHRNLVLVQSAGPVRLTVHTPSEGARVGTVRPRVSAEWSGAVSPDEVALILDSTDVTAVSTVTPTSVVYDALLPLTPGRHTARLAAGDLLTSWGFEVAEVTEASPSSPLTPSTPAEPFPASDPAAAALARQLRREWAVTPLASVSIRSGDEQDTAALQVSTQADLSGEVLSSKAAGDLSFRHPLEGGGETVQESQNWLARVGARQGQFAEELTVGYVVPEFLDQTQFLTLGTARGGATGKIATPFGRLFAYQSFESAISGVTAGTFAPVQDVRAYAWEAPSRSERFALRAIALDVDEQPGLYSPGGSGESFGIFGRYAWSPVLNITVEAARASFLANGSGGREEEGDAVRLGLNGTRGRVGYQLNLRRTDAEYVNPANRGFTYGAVSNRQGGDLAVTTMLGKTALSVSARHLRSAGDDASTPDGSENGVTATLSSMLGRIVTVSASLNWTADESEADPIRSLPAVDRSVNGAQLTFGQLLGRLHLSQTLQYNRTESREGPFGDATVSGATLTAAGPMSRFGNLSAFVSMIRSETTPEAGVMDQLVLTLQPSLVVGSHLSIQPVMSYSRMTNDVLSMESETQSFTPMVTWSPQWFRQAMALQVSGGWRRTETAGQPAMEPDPTYAATLSFRWPMRSGAVAQPASILPGATPIAAPEEGSANPVHSATAPATDVAPQTN